MNMGNLNDDCLMLFQCCMLVKGHSRALICDVQRGQLYFIPNTLYFILTSYDDFSINEIKDSFDEVYHEYIDEYFAFLVENELAIRLPKEEKKMFPKISTEWRTPLPLTNAVIDIGKQFDKGLVSKGIQQLSALKCYAIQIRFFDETDLANIQYVLDLCAETSIRALSILIKDSPGLSNDILTEWTDKYQKVQDITLHTLLNRSKYSPNQTILLNERSVTSSLCCGNITQAYFTTSIDLFTESLHHNTCLNRKIAIDVDGNIKNCPSMAESFGNIRETTLDEALLKPGFKKYWDITKDKIHVCKDCEFRHICTDCRAYVEDPEDIFSKPLKCGYNPYTGDWSEWSTNPLKQKNIDHYGLREIVDIAGEM